MTSFYRIKDTVVVGIEVETVDDSISVCVSILFGIEDTVVVIVKVDAVVDSVTVGISTNAVTVELI